MSLSPSARPARGRILLTVPHVNRAASPYREMMALAKYLSRNEFTLTVCTLRDGGFEESKRLLASMDVPCFVAPFRPRGKTLPRILESVAAQRTIAQYGPFDVQHSLDFTSSPFEAALARMARRSYIYNQRNLNDKGHRNLLRLKIRLSNCVVVIAGHVASFVRSLGADGSFIREVLNGIDIEEADREMAATPQRESNRILMVGQVVSLKRYEDAIRAFSLLRSDDPTLRLEVAGPCHDQKYLDSLNALVASLGLEPGVSFLGPRSDVLPLMRDSRVLLLCSRTEGLPWAALEAMTARVPIVASDIAAHRELINDASNGLLVPMGNPTAIAAALRRLLNDPLFCASLTRQARDTVEARFSAQAMVAGIEEIYRDVLGTSKVAAPASLSKAASNY